MKPYLNILKTKREEREEVFLSPESIVYTGSPNDFKEKEDRLNFMQKLVLRARAR
jgi:hypothetical protein